MRYSTGFCLLMSLTWMACSKSSDDTSTVGNWIHKVDFKGAARTEAVSFTINDTAFVGTGYDGTNRLKDFYSYDAERNTWTQRASLPDAAPGRQSAVAFSIGGKGYMGTGTDGITKYNDFYEYDPATNTWTAKAPFPGTPRWGAVAFAGGGVGYIATGYDGNWLNDMYEYNPASNSWAARDDVPNSKRQDAAAFVIGDSAYIVSGSSNQSTISELSRFDLKAKTWALKRPVVNISDDDYDNDYTSIAGTNCAVFVMSNKAYLATGAKPSISSVVWEYDPVTDLWDQKQAFEGAARSGAVGFNIKNRGFVTTGSSGSVQLSDTWEFDPVADYNKND